MIGILDLETLGILIFFNLQNRRKLVAEEVLHNEIARKEEIRIKEGGLGEEVKKKKEEEKEVVEEKKGDEALQQVQAPGETGNG